MFAGGLISLWYFDQFTYHKFFSSIRNYFWKYVLCTKIFIPVSFQFNSASITLQFLCFKDSNIFSPYGFCYLINFQVCIKIFKFTEAIAFILFFQANITVLYFSTASQRLKNLPRTSLKAKQLLQTSSTKRGNYSLLLSFKFQKMVRLVKSYTFWHTESLISVDHILVF